MQLRLRAIGVLAFVFVVLVGYFSKPAALPTQYRGLQLAKSVEEVNDKILPDRDKARIDITKALQADNFPFIPAYSSLFILVVLAALIGRIDCSWTTWLAIFAAFSISAAAQSDYLENIYTLEVLTKTSPEIVKEMYRASVAKWVLSFATILLLTPSFLWQHRWIRMIGCLYLCSTFFGFAGLIVYRPALQWAFIPLGIALLLSAAVFTFCSRKFLNGS